MAFVKLIEFHTRHMDKMEELIDKWIADTNGRRTTFRSIVGRSRDDVTHYIEIVEFASEEEAERNGALSVSTGVHEQMVALIEGTPRMVDLEVTRDTRFYPDSVTNDLH